MEYVIVDYERGSTSRKKCRKLFKHLRKYIQLKQLQIDRQVRVLEEMPFVFLTIQADAEELKCLPPAGIAGKLRQEMDADARIFLAEPKVVEFLPQDSLWCDNPVEVCLPFLRAFMPQMIEGQSICRKYAKLLILDDGTYDIYDAVKVLSKGWNYVTVCSSCQEALEAVYEQLYEEEGLMVQTVEWTPRAVCEGDVVIDFSGNYKGIHHIYPKGCVVFDLTFSKEKSRYLQDKGRTDVRYFDFKRAVGLMEESESG